MTDDILLALLHRRISEPADIEKNFLLHVRLFAVYSDDHITTADINIV